MNIPGVGAQSGYYRGGNFPADPTKFVAFGCTSNCVSYASTTPIPNASGGATGGIGREIDILETKWQPSGPQINLPNGESYFHSFLLLFIIYTSCY